MFEKGDYYRNRLTHTLEVSQIARTLAKYFKLNEDLIKFRFVKIPLDNINLNKIRNGLIRYSSFDMELIDRAAQVASIPLVVSGGAGNLEHCVKALSVEEVDAIAVASILHYNIESVGNIKEEADADGIKIR